MISVDLDERHSSEGKITTVDHRLTKRGRRLWVWSRIDLIEIDPFRNEMELFVLEKIEKWQS